MFISFPHRSGHLLAAALQRRCRAAVHLAGGLIVMGVILAGPAIAQTSGSAPSDSPSDSGPTSENYRRVASACKADYATFCSASSPRTATGREQTMCLKFHRQDLTLGCRSAVNAATR